MRGEGSRAAGPAAGSRPSGRAWGDQEPMGNQPPRFGLALGGGGLRGLAHIGVLKGLAEAGYTPDIVTGTSSGAILAALWACGWTPQQMEDVARRLRNSELYDSAITVGSALAVVFQLLGLRMRPRHSVPRGMLQGAKLERLIGLWTRGARLEQLERPVAVMAADVRSGRAAVFCPPAYRQRVQKAMPGAIVIDRGSLAAAVRASIAIPGIFEPKVIDSHVLVDGGVKDKVPAEAARALGADVVVAVDVSAQERREPVGLFDFLGHAFDLMARDLAALKLERFADLVLQPRLPDIQLTELHRIPECIEAGARALREALDDLERLLHPAPGGRVSEELTS